MKKVMLVDDSRTVRLIGRQIVEGAGVAVAEAENGEDALEVFHREGDVDGVLLDWNMPVMDGLSCLKALRRVADASRLRIVMCTTENDFEHISQALEAGADEYVMKPFTEEIIREKLLSLATA